MLGIAQKLYIEKFKTNPWKAASQKEVAWPFLEKMLAVNYLGYVDFALAQRILQKVDQTEESCAALICHLSMAARQGHLCVLIEQNNIYPAVEDVWQSGEETPKLIDPQLVSNLKTLIQFGAKIMDARLISDMNSPQASIEVPICRQDDRFYLQRHWIVETQVLNHLKILLGNKVPEVTVDMDQAERMVTIMQSEGRLLPEQALAVMQGCRSPFTIISGGPGTGKTHTAGIFLRTFWQCLSKEQRARCRFALAAPTGKAAAQLEGSIRRSMQGVADFPALTAQTLHMLLGLSRQSKLKSRPVLSADVILVDESSMMDARMIGILFESLKPGARVILLGDKNQLPPIESGSLFADLVNHLQSELKISPVIELKTCLRAELKGIIDLSNTIKLGDIDGVFDLLSQGLQGVKYVPCLGMDQAKDLQRRLLSDIFLHYPVVETVPADPMALLKQFSAFRLLTPMRQGPLGVEALNALFYQAMMNGAKNADCLVVPIMIAANQHRLGLFNGEMGLLVKFLHNSSADFAIFASRQEGQEVRKISALLLPKFEYAYCVSVHKSQGSEFDHVVLLLPEGAEGFGREALYTGLTRAKRYVEVWGAESVLREMISRRALRHSGISERLKNFHVCLN